MEPLSVWTNDDPRLHLLSWGGEGVPLLLTHGMAGNAHWWDFAAPHLLESFKPAALDFHGHGESQWRADGRYDAEGFTQNIETARHALGWERMVLAGHSLGARIALEYAKRYPNRLTALIAVDFLPEFYESNSRKFERTRTRSQPHYADPERMRRGFHLEPKGTLMSPGALHEFAGHCLRKNDEGYTWKFDWKAFLFPYEPIWPLLGEIRVPTLIVRGGKSTVMDRSAFERTVEALPGARGVEIPEAHHHVPLDAPERLARELAQFAAAR